jgi:hypothetical protein
MGPETYKFFRLDIFPAVWEPKSAIKIHFGAKVMLPTTAIYYATVKAEYQT